MPRSTPSPRSNATRGFDFSWQMNRLCEDITRRLPDLQHIDMRRVAVAVCQTRKPVAHGLYASLTPLRFENGAEVGDVHGKLHTVERVYASNGQEVLYVLSFYLPRFMDVPIGEKLVTILHELWHISPSFDGDIRRFSGRCYAHTGSQAEYDAAMEVLAKRWLARNPPEYLYAFLRLNFTELRETFGGVFGAKVRRPRLLPVSKRPRNSSA